MGFQQILMAAATQAGGAAGSPYGPELVVNGGFATDTDWDKPAGGSISGGKLNLVAVLNGGLTSQSPYVLTDTVIYKVDFTIDSITAGALIASIGAEGQVGTTRSTPGTFSENLAAGFDEGNTINLSVSGTTSAVIDNVSVKQVL